MLYLGLVDRLPGSDVLDEHTLSSWGHAVGTMVLAMLLYLVVVSFTTLPPWSAALLVAIGATLFGAVIEGLQALSGYRDPSVGDALLDAAGAAIGVTALTIVRPRTAVASRVATLGTSVLVVVVVAGAVFATPPPRAVCSTTELATRRAAAVGGGTSTRQRTGPLASYDLRTGRGREVPDTSGVEPVLDLQLTRSGVRRLDGEGVRFSGGAARSVEAATKIARATARSGAVTLEAWVRSRDLRQSGPTRIATMSDGTERTQVNAHLGEEGGALSVRLRATCGSFNWWTVPHAFKSTNTAVHVAMTFTGHVQRMYAQGALVQAVRLDGRLGDWDPDYPFVVGNEASLDRPFRGDVLFVAVYDRALSGAEIAEHAAQDPTASSP
jgi:hypothetical protein